MTATDAMVRQADHLIDLGRTGDAVALLEKVLAQDPDNVTALCELARARINEHRFNEARVAASAALGLAPHGPYPLFLYASALTRLGLPDAVGAAEAAFVAAPHDWVTSEVLAEALRKAGRTEAALVAARRIVALAPDSAAAQAAWADLASSLGEPYSARYAYQEALRLDPTCAHARHNLATVRAGGTPRETVRHLFAAAAMDPTMAVAAQNLRSVVRLGVQLGLTLSFLAAAPSWLVSYFVWRVSDATMPAGARVFVAVLVALLLGVCAAATATVPRRNWVFVLSTVRGDRYMLIAALSSIAIFALLIAFAATGLLSLLVAVAVPFLAGAIAYPNFKTPA